MKKQPNRNGRYRRLLIVWVLLAVVMAAAITITGVGILTSQIKTDRRGIRLLSNPIPSAVTTCCRASV